MVGSIQTGNIQLLNQITKKAGIEQKSTDSVKPDTSRALPDEVSLSTQSEQTIKQLQYLDRQLTKFSDFLNGTGEFDPSLISDDAPFKARPALNEQETASIREIAQKSAPLSEEDVSATLKNTQISLTDERVSLISSQNRESLSDLVS